MHIRKADRARPLTGRQGVATYLDQEQILGIARQEACDSIHSGVTFHAIWRSSLHMIWRGC
ncbi:MAG: hypothetical protein ETSY1_42080 [Candidatus Entotheonella factor]|uniref:Biotin carboxylase-like N-terminal domain-containing protein n=1 Tax=Entotheonella factor TaxID=1429438 RepID=W4L444_ENTF1|nr:MAG: hypothetical protein ETSY1_42080 [Candidatus Entotheonella factor]